MSSHINKSEKVVKGGEPGFIFRLAFPRNFAVLLIVFAGFFHPGFFTYECSCFFTHQWLAFD